MKYCLTIFSVLTLLIITTGTAQAIDRNPPAPAFGFRAENITQIEKSAWLVTKPYYFNGSDHYWLGIDARPESDEDQDLADREICKKLGFQNTRAGTNVPAYPWLDNSSYNLATLNSRAEILGLDKDLVSVTPTFVYLRLICVR